MPLSWNEIKDRAFAFSRKWEDEESEDHGCDFALLYQLCRNSFQLITSRYALVLRRPKNDLKSLTFVQTCAPSRNENLVNRPLGDGGFTAV